LLYELLTGEVPYQASTPMAVGQRALEARLTPPRMKNPAVSDAVARVVTRAVAREQGLRYPSCAELLSALTTAIEHDPGRTIVQSVPTVQAAPEPKPAPTPVPASTPKPISPVPFIAIGSVLAAVLT